MKIFIVQETGYEYNDEYYREPNCYPRHVGKPIKAYRGREAAEQEANRLSLEKMASHYAMRDEKDEVLTDLFHVIELDVSDNEVLDEAQASLELDRLAEEAAQLLGSTIRQKAASLFAEYPILESFGWKQFTSYYNDGDSCDFTVWGCDPLINGASCDELRPYDKNLVKRLHQLIESIDEDDMRRGFGDHVQVTIHREGPVEIEEFTEHS